MDLRERLRSGLPVTERRLPLAGVSTSMWEGGDGPPIVLLAGEFAAVWMRVIPDLVTTHRVIAADLPGLGASEGSGDVLSWLDELVEQTSSAPPVLVGKGLGGALAARYAVAHSDRIAHLVLVDAQGLERFRPPPGMALTFLSVLMRPTERGLERSFRRYCFVDLDRVRREMGEHYDWMVAYALNRFRTPSVNAAMRSLGKRLAPAIPEADLDRIAAPTTLIWGRHDVAVPLRIAETAAARRGWPLHVIEGARDDPAVEQPDAFMAALRSTACLPSTSRR